MRSPLVYLFKVKQYIIEPISFYMSLGNPKKNQTKNNYINILINVPV